MAFALSIKSKLDFPSAGKVFLVLTLIVASFTLIYSTFFLDIVLKRCGIADFCKAHNFEDSSLNNNTRTRLSKNCFEILKIKLKEINENYLKRFIIRNSSDEQNNSSINDNVDVNKFCASYGKRDNLMINEVKNSSTNEIRNNVNDNVDVNVNHHLQNVEILDKADKRASLQLTSFNSRNAADKIRNNIIDEKEDNLTSNFNFKKSSDAPHPPKANLTMNLNMTTNVNLNCSMKDSSNISS